MEANDPRLTFGRFLAEIRQPLRSAARDRLRGPRDRLPRARARGAPAGARADRVGRREGRARGRAHGQPPGVDRRRLRGGHAGRGARPREHLRDPGRAQVRAPTQRRVGPADAARALQKHRFLEDLLAEYPAIALGRAGPAALPRLPAAAPGRVPRRSTRRAAASRPGASCSRTSRGSATRCSTPLPPRSSPATTAC